MNVALHWRWPFYGHENIVQLLLIRGADVNVLGVGKFSSALHSAVFSGNEHIVQLLINRGADVNQQARTWGTALAKASYHGRKTIVSLLIEKGADVNTKGGRPQYNTALAAAAVGGHADIVQLLLDNGADVHMLDERLGNHNAINEVIVQLLMQHRAIITEQQW